MLKRATITPMKWQPQRQRRGYRPLAMATKFLGLPTPLMLLLLLVLQQQQQLPFLFQRHPVGSPTSRGGVLVVNGLTIPSRTVRTGRSLSCNMANRWQRTKPLQPPCQPSYMMFAHGPPNHDASSVTPAGGGSISTTLRSYTNVRRLPPLPTQHVLGTTRTTMRLYSTLDPGQSNSHNNHTTETFPNDCDTGTKDSKRAIQEGVAMKGETTNYNSDQSPAKDDADKSMVQRSKTETVLPSSSTLQQDGIPSYKTMILFITTTILIWLSEPLLSLVDTTIVGQYSTNVMQLAALGPATMLMDSAIYMTYFLAIATTNKVANGLAQQDYRTLQTSTSQVLGFATVLGTMITALIHGAGRPLLHRAAGGSSSPALLQLALTYCQIRSLVAPLAILGMVAQSVCLACLDTTTPALAVAVASLVNVVGDVLLVPHLGMQGAAIATAVASSTAALILLRQVRRIMMGWRSKEEQDAGTQTTHDISNVWNGIPRLEYGNQNNNTHTETNTATPTGLSMTKMAPTVPFWSLPGPAALQSLLLLTGPIFFCLVGKIICYSALSLRASDFGVTALAAHNVMIRIFFFGATFGDPLSQASQTFVPRLMTSTTSSSSNTTSRGRRLSATMATNKSKRKLIRRMAIIAAAFGIGTKLSAQLVLTRFGSYFTNDASILELLRHASGWAGWALLLHPFVMLLEGCILASQDLFFLLGSYGVTMACHFASLKLNATSFAGVWRALFFFQTFRLAQFMWRVWDQSLRERHFSAVTDGVTGAGVTPSVVVPAK